MSKIWITNYYLFIIERQKSKKRTKISPVLFPLKLFLIVPSLEFDYFFILATEERRDHHISPEPSLLVADLFRCIIINDNNR